MTVEYLEGAVLPDLAIFWKDSFGNLIDFSSGYTFQVRLTDPADAVMFTKTTNITGAVGSLLTNPPTPNLVVAWAAADLGAISITVETEYDVEVKATRSSDSKPRFLRGRLRLVPAV